MNSIFNLLYFNKSVLSGAMDMIVIKQPDNSFKATPLRVRFSQFQILKAKEKIVQLTINGHIIDLPTRLSEHGEVYILHENPKKVSSSFQSNTNASEGSLSPSETSPPSSPINLSSSFSLVRIDRKLSFDLLMKPPLENKIQIVNETSFSIDPLYDKPVNDEYIFPGMKLELSDCWNAISKRKDDKTFNCEEHFKMNQITKEEFIKDPWKVINNFNLAIKYEKHIYTWKVIAPIILSKLAYCSTLPEESLKLLTQQEMGFLLWKTVDQNAYKIDISKSQQSSPYHNPISTLIDKQMPSPSLLNSTTLYPLHLTFRKSYTLSSDHIAKMNLLPGKNIVIFSVTSTVQGKQELSSEIFLWNYDDKVVISDLDGTITRTDVIGQIIPYFGKDWAHHKVAKLFQSIERNGYKIIYLTARTMCVHVKTKNYLNSINQDNLTMPHGPVLMSPDGLVNALKQEIIDRTPQSFKIECLTQVINLFPDDINPFYAGIGNKKSDAIAYESVGINKTKIYIINEKGEISMSNNCYRTSYDQLDDNVDGHFPYVKGNNTFFYDLSYYTPPMKDYNINDLFK